MGPLPYISETFPEYVDHLPLWEQDPFARLEMSFGCYTILELIGKYPVADILASLDYTQRNLLSLIPDSDGSPMDFDMTFSWTMSQPNCTHIVSCSGPAPGLKDSPFRAKAYGMLSMVQFLFHLFSFCDASHAWQTRLSTNNQSLLQRIREYQQYTTYFPNAALNAD
jgi:hypothetical protein